MEKKLRKVVLESPYGNQDPSKVERNVRYAKACVRDCLLRGEAPIASHLLFTQPDILIDAVPEERAQGMAAGHAWISVADAVVVYSNLGVSSGMRAGIDEAIRLNVPLEWRQLPGNDWV